MQKEQKVIVTRVPPALADEIEKLAQKELMPVAACVRRLLLLATTVERAPRVVA